MACERCDSVNFDMICETHPWLEWPHDDCGGPGCPPSAAVGILHWRLHQLQLVIRAREATIVELFYTLKEQNTMDTKEQTQEPHAWEPQWNLWQRITTALRAFEESMDADTDPLLRMEVADLNQVLLSLRDPALPVEEKEKCDA